MPDFETLLELSVIPPEVVVELDEQLVWAPPTPTGEAACNPRGLMTIARAANLLGPLILRVFEKLWPELVVDALELVAQLPELPLIPCPKCMPLVPTELLQLYAIVVLGVFVIRNVAASTTIPLINSNLFTFVIELRTISVIRYDILKLYCRA